LNSRSHRNFSPLYVHTLFVAWCITDLPKQPLVIDLNQQSDEVFLPAEQGNKTLSPPRSPHVAAGTTTKKSRTNPKNHLNTNFNEVVSHRAEFGDKGKAKKCKSTKKADKHKQARTRKASEPPRAANSKKPLMSREVSRPILIANNCRLTKINDDRSPSNINRYNYTCISLL